MQQQRKPGCKPITLAVLGALTFGGLGAGKLARRHRDGVEG